MTALAVQPSSPPPSAAPEPEAAPIACPACGLNVPPIEWQKKLCYAPHNGPDDNDCPTSYKTIANEEGMTYVAVKQRGFERIMEVVPQTYGEAFKLYPTLLENVPGHEWDNRTTLENADWLIRELLPRAFPVDPAPTAKARRRRKAQPKKTTPKKGRKW